MNGQTLQHEACFRNIAPVAENAKEASGVRGHRCCARLELAAARGAETEEEQQLRRARQGLVPPHAGDNDFVMVGAGAALGAAVSGRRTRESVFETEQLLQELERWSRVCDG